MLQYPAENSNIAERNSNFKSQIRYANAINERGTEQSIRNKCLHRSVVRHLSLQH